MHVAIVSREVYPLAPGGIGAYVTALAHALHPHAAVTLVTTDAVRERYERLREEGHLGLPPEDVRLVFVPEPHPEDVGSFYSFMHCYSARVLDALREAFPDRGPDVLEFSDYLGEGAVTAQAARCGEPFLHDTTLVVKLHSTAELVDVLNGRIRDDLSTAVTYALERHALRFADRILFGGGDVFATYERFYGNEILADAQVVRQPIRCLQQRGNAPDEDLAAGRRPLRILYMGRMERRKGVQNLVRAVTASPTDRFTVTIVGGDTDTAPLATSMRAQLELMVASDPRVDLRGPVDRRDIAHLVAAHDLLVVPSLWECWPNVALEALAGNRPVLASPVGGLAEMIGPELDGRGGWLVADTTPDALTLEIERLADNRAEVAEVIEACAPLRRFDALTEEPPVVATYARLAEERPRAPRATASHDVPLVSVVVPYFKLDAYLPETIESIFDQTYRRLEVIVVNDGSTREQDRILEDLAARRPIRVVTQPNSGLSAARNLGVRLARGRYVVPLDADNMLEPDFIRRTVAVLEADRHTAYVTSWTRYVDEEGSPLADPGGGYQPLGNTTELVHRTNVAGDAIALLRRSLFDRGFAYDVDLTSYEDWMLYRDLHAAGLVGHVIPERLIRYRVRGGSMLREIGEPRYDRLQHEMAAHYRREQVRWTS